MEGKDLRIVFMGTPEFAVASLRRLVEEGYNIVAVVTTPDKPAGRGQKLHESDVKLTAKELGLPILQPEKLRDEEFLANLKALDIDLGIAAQSMLLKAVEMGLNGICIGAFNAEQVREALQLPYPPLLIIAIGKGTDKISLTKISPSDSHAYYRNEGTHYVPKVQLDDLIIK